MPTFTVDSSYKGPRSFTLSVYLINRGIKQIFKPRSKVFITVDLDKHMVFIHKEYTTDNVKDAFSFAEISQVIPDISRRHENRYYTDVLAYERSYRFLFKNINEWYIFTEAFRHIHRDHSQDTLFTTNESYLQFVISYFSDKKANEYDFQSPDAVKMIDSRSDSGDEDQTTKEKYINDRAPDTIYSADVANEDRNRDKIMQEGNMGEGLTKNQENQLHRTDGDRFNPNNPNFDKTIAVNVDKNATESTDIGNDGQQKDLHQEATSNLK